MSPDGDVAANALPNDPSLGNDDAPGGRTDDIGSAASIPGGLGAFASGTKAFRSPGVRGAERWIALQLQAPGTVSIDYVRVREEHVRPTLGDYAGHFLSSDDQLNRVWYASAYTFALDSFKDLRPGFDGANVVVTDGAKRDRLVWLGDLVVENLLGGYALRQAPTVIRDSLAAFSCQQKSDGELQVASDVAVTCPPEPPPPGSPPPPGASDTNPVIANAKLPEYTAWWIVGVHDYDLFTGDDAFARRMLPVIRRGLGYFISHLGADGLYSTPAGAINWHPFDNAQGEDTHTNAVLYRALLAAAGLERRIGGGRVVAHADEELAASVRHAMLARLWDPAAHAFVLNAQDPSNHTQDAQVEAVLDGVVTGPQADGALRFVDTHLRTTYGVRNGQSDSDPYMSNYISPYIGSTELLARFARFDATGALGLLRREWGHMVDTDPNSTVWEKMAFDGDAASYSPNQTGNSILPSTLPVAGPGTTSLAHGWSGGPVPALSGYVLGIRPTTPGFARWIVEPQPGDLRYAQGQAPTPHGLIISRWQRGPNDTSFRLTVTAPTGTAGQVAVPELGRPRTIARDGHVIWRHGHPIRGTTATQRDGHVVFSSQDGTHTSAWSIARIAQHRRRPRPRFTG